MVGMFAQRGIKNVSANFTKLDRTYQANKTYKKQAILFLFCILFLSVGASVEAGKVRDIKKRVRTKVSVFLPASRSQSQSVKTSIFFSPMETNIIGGPEQNSTIQYTKVDFLLDGWQVLPFKKTTQFDIWLIGYDTGWRSAGNKISYNLPPGPKTYTLLARAKNERGEFDNTAASRSFNVDVSENFGRVKIISVNYRGSSSRPNYEKITIGNRGVDTGINVTGWTLKTRRFKHVIEIPKASAVFNPRNLDEGDNIYLAKGGTVDFYVGKGSPLGVNFQENSCDGYMASAFESYDALSSSGRCTLPDSYSYNDFSISCRNFVRGINSCREPKLEYYSFINEPSCREFITKNYTYQACVDRSKNQASFYLGRWKVYLGRNAEILDDLDDTVYLYDNKGLLVDAFRY